MKPENLPKAVILHRTDDPAVDVVRRVLDSWNVTVHEADHVSRFRGKQVFDEVVAAIAVGREGDFRSTDFLRSVMHVNLVIQRVLLSPSVNPVLVENAVNNAHIDYFLQLPLDIAAFSEILEKANDRFTLESRPIDRYEALSRAASRIRSEKERYRREAKVDALTQLMNRRSFNTILLRILHRAKDRETVFSLAILDIDHFKVINDTHGHLNGDKVLQLFSVLIRNDLRIGMDYAFRYGGEEFAIISMDTSEPEMMTLVSRILAKVRESSVDSDDGAIRFTFSAGIAQHDSGIGAEEMINRADEALYRAKSAGRNRVMLWRSEP